MKDPLVVRACLTQARKQLEGAIRSGQGSVLSRGDIRVLEEMIEKTHKIRARLIAEEELDRCTQRR